MDGAPPEQTTRAIFFLRRSLPMSFYFLRETEPLRSDVGCEVCGERGHGPGDVARVFSNDVELGFVHVECMRRRCWNEKRRALDCAPLVELLYDAYAEEVTRALAWEMLGDLFGDGVALRSDPRSVLADKLDDFAGEVSRAGDALSHAEVDAIAEHLNVVWEMLMDPA